MTRPRELRTHFLYHKTCSWRFGSVRQKRFNNGDVVALLMFEDDDCQFVDGLPIDHEDQYVMISDGLRKAMGWARDGFLFATGTFYRVDTVDGYPDLGRYLPTYFHCTDQGLCRFEQSAQA